MTKINDLVESIPKVDEQMAQDMWEIVKKHAE